ncbi:MAG: hypothetical protein IKX89_07525 [Firmicutes bacterium]|nr:hypothetical protein [Bacillota bacterium]
MTYRPNNIFYAAGPDLWGTFRIAVTLTEAVDPQALRHAAERAAERFPYFAVRLIRRGEEYVLEDNPLPFVISEEGWAAELGSKESNYHLFAFAWDGRRIYMDASHFMTDGNGCFPFLKSLLYYYLSYVHPEESFDLSGIALAGSKILPEEADDYPYPDQPLESEPLGTAERPEEIFELPDQPEGYDGMDGWTSFLFSLRQREMMSFVSGVDGSPATFMASLMYKAITACHPGEHLPVVCGMQHQFRSALGKPASHMCHINIVPMVYPDRLRNRDIEMLNTIGRGILILNADDASDTLTVNRHIENESRIKSMTLAEKRRFMRREVLDGIGKNTFEVSYTGHVDWSGLDRYIVNVIPYFDLSLSGGLSIEVFSVGEVFCVNVMQRNGDTKYVDAFSRMLEKCGISHATYDPEHFLLSRCRLPE